MIPTSYLFKDLYTDRWGDPANPHAVDVPSTNEPPRSSFAIFAPFVALFRRPRPARPNAWSFTIPTGVDHNRT